MMIVEFIEARIAEDEASARRAIGLTESDGSESESNEWQWIRLSDDGSSMFFDGVPTPARVLRECAAKREIVEALAEDVKSGDWRQAGNADDLLRTTAAAYSDHPDYRHDWDTKRL